MLIGIDQMAFATSDKYVDMVDLAHARNQEPGKFLIGIGQTEQAVIPVTQDVVTMGANAAEQVVDDSNRDAIDLVIFGTESGVDNSKSAAIYVQRLLNLNRYARTIEMKQACYAGTAGLMMARDYIAAHPGKKALIIAADIARYGLETAGEVTQGGGAVAMIVSENPQILALNDDSQYMSADIMDFWRPVYRTEALVDGHYSANIYEDFFKEVWDRYREVTGNSINDFKAFAFHLPFTKMGLKGLREILPEADESKQTDLLEEFEASRVYNKRIGNLYTGSLYLSLISLLSNSTDLQAGDRLGLFSYGSGAEGEFYSGILQPNYKAGLKTDFGALFEKRQRVSIAEYEAIFNKSLPIDGTDLELDVSDDSAHFVLGGLQAEQRQYFAH
ncbi:hydroxymethylglutaryl-CoA synthase [Periweissella cryptocerci]|uniref:Hydroxymethylglutaryl-CoA synthase n=1 Tax=Periweissella cryptocerci TaxID=2506420 RepID=A0A4P6YR78_9LACO|nr:hydroxymethylglutaryl-CoA synthase [Periweissella cryptocerci]QBO35111.1 hydroxymethylglutaryl-CoA synthase [Periweissella cryptocerci]